MDSVSSPQRPVSKNDKKIKTDSEGDNAMFKKTIIMVTVFFLFIVIGNNYALAQNARITKSGYLASTSEELLDKAIEYAVAKDHAALQKILDTHLVFMLKGGLRVYIVDTKIFSGKVKIRPVGETFEVWTLIEAVSNK